MSVLEPEAFGSSLNELHMQLEKAPGDGAIYICILALFEQCVFSSGTQTKLQSVLPTFSFHARTPSNLVIIPLYRLWYLMRWNTNLYN